MHYKLLWNSYGEKYKKLTKSICSIGIQYNPVDINECWVGPGVEGSHQLHKSASCHNSPPHNQCKKI